LINILIIWVMLGAIECIILDGKSMMLKAWIKYAEKRGKEYDENIDMALFITITVLGPLFFGYYIIQKKYVEL
jgi:hypothetical protein